MKKNIKTKNLHPWRLCPAGKYYRRASVVHSYTRTDGTFVSGHSRSETCALNPSGKDQLYPDEINEIAKIHFNDQLQMPCAINVKNKLFVKFDLSIAGWTKYWNDVFDPDILLDPNFVKALIDSESTFREGQITKNKKKRPLAWGLLQLRNQTRKILGDEKGELKDHYLTLTIENLLDGNVNICAGIRWLFQKHNLASKKLKRLATWDEAIVEYKGLDLNKTRDQEILNNFLDKYERYSKCKK